MKIIKFITLAIIAFYTGSALAQNATTQISDEQAHEIVFNGTPDDVKKLVETGYDVNKVYMCNTLLTEAIRSAARGANARKYPLFAINKIKILINSGADINLIPCPGMGMSALNWAVSLPTQLREVEHNANEIINERIKTKTGVCNFPGVVSKPCADITPAEREKIRKAIRDAMKILNQMFVSKFMEIIEYLVDNGALIDNNEENGKKIAPIHLAAANPEEITLEPLNYLIKKGANLNIKDEHGNTPLFFAFSSNNDKSVKLLIEAGADDKIKNSDNVLYNEVQSQEVHVFINTEGNITEKILQ